MVYIILKLSIENSQLIAYNKMPWLLERFGTTSSHPEQRSETNQRQ